LRLLATSSLLEFLDDQGRELPREEGFIRQSLIFGGQLRLLGITSRTWDAVAALPQAFEPLAWDELLLDARAALPKPGPAVVLAYAAIETLSFRVCERLWEGAGRSLKDEGALWEAFRNLREARNSYVHERKARVGASLLTPAHASALVGKAREIISWLEAFSPPELRRPALSPPVRVESSVRIQLDSSRLVPERDPAESEP
jgi:hypothetical protein